MTTFDTVYGLALLTTRLGRRITRHRRRATNWAERLAMLPLRGAPVSAPVAVHWNDHGVPYIDASTDEDLAVGFGVVHAHLRLAQLEIMRRLACGRLSEVIGPAALDVDHVLRVLEFDKAVPNILTMMPEETRRFLCGFRDGINYVIGKTSHLPEEFQILDINPEPWTEEDLAALGRLAANDFTWKVWIRLLRLRGRPDWIKLWQRLMEDGGAPLPGYAGGGSPGLDVLDGLLGGLSRHGSNSVAVAGSRSISGGAMIASDPHLSVSLPNLFLVCGCRSPSFNMVGLMIPGVPAMALGRNPWIAWGGTSLHAASSDLVDVSSLPASDIAVREERIPVRWGRPRHIEIRETPHGPIITDSPLLKAPTKHPLALKWVGHETSDELTALLRANRAQTWDEFRDALEGFAVPAQNMIFADVKGRVGQLMAAHLPARPHGTPEDVAVQPAALEHWRRTVRGRALPWTFNPEGGFVASANNRPDEQPETPIGYFFSPNDRIDRLRTVLGGSSPIAREDLVRMQRDVTVPSAPILRDRLLALVQQHISDPAAEEPYRTFIRALENWDGRYSAESQGPVAFELLVYHLAEALHGKEDMAIFTATWEPWALISRDLDRTPQDQLAKATARAVKRATAKYKRFSNWGAMHRLRLAHPFGSIPRIGRRYRFGDHPVSGSNETVMKTAHGFAAGRHSVRLGAIARHISEMGEPDANYFVLLGGQDGWLGSTASTDLTALWRRGSYVQVPLRAEVALNRLQHRTVLMP